MNRRLVLSLILLMSGTWPLTVRPEIVLYDGDLGTLPASQGWLYATDPFFGASAIQSLTAGGIRLDSSPVKSDKAGYFSNTLSQMPGLNREAGFKVVFDARLENETHDVVSRAGFSIIVIAGDLAAIEIGFWTNAIWAQGDDPLFVRAEETVFNTADAVNRYEIEFLGGRYTLSANGTTILSGPLRNYASFGFPYNSPSFVFWGDDTSSASAAVEVNRVSLSLYPRITGFTADSDGWNLSADNLENGTAYSVQVSGGMTGTAWTTIGSLTSTGSVSTGSGLDGEGSAARVFRVTAAP